MGDKLMASDRKTALVKLSSGASAPARDWQGFQTALDMAQEALRAKQSAFEVRCLHAVERSCTGAASELLRPAGAREGGTQEQRRAGSTGGGPPRRAHPARWQGGTGVLG